MKTLDAKSTDKYEEFRAKWNKWHESSRSHKLHCDYETLFDLLTNPCNTLKSIGDRFGVSRERVRQIYSSFVVPVLEEWPAHYREPYGRKKACTLKTEPIRLRSGPPHKATPEVLEVWYLLKSMDGYDLSREPLGGSTRIANRWLGRRSWIRVNGHSCAVRYSSRPINDYYHVNNPCNGHLVANQLTDGFMLLKLKYDQLWLVIPSEDLRGRGTGFYVRSPSFPGNRSWGNNLLRYSGRWDLLK